MLEFVKDIFNKHSSRLLGIDVSTSAIKLLELSASSSGYQIESFAAVPLPSGAIIDKEIKDSGIVADTIRQLVKRSGTRLTTAAIAIPDSSVITRIVLMDKNLSVEEIESQIAFEAEKYISHPLNEVSIDFEVLGQNSKNAELVDVLLVASHTKNVESRVDALMEGGLLVKVVDVESYAMERAFSLLPKKLTNSNSSSAIAIVDIGATVTTLTVLYQGTTIFNRSEIFGGQQLTNEIQKSYNLTYAEAGLAKKQGKLPGDYQQKILEPFKEAIILQIRRALQFFFSASQNIEVSQLILAGGSVAIPGLVNQVEAQIGISTSLANPFSGMSIAPQVNSEALMRDANSMMISCGLALRSFDKPSFNMIKEG